MKKNTACFSKAIVVGLTLLVFGLPIVLAAENMLDPTDPHRFYGNIANAPVGTTITATLNSVTAGTLAITTAGQYGCASGADCHQLVVYTAGASAGDTISFSAGSGSSLTPATYSYQPGNITRLNFDYTATAAVSGSTGGGGGGGGVSAKETTTLVADQTTINKIKSTLPSEWSNVRIDQVGDPSTETKKATISDIDAAISSATDTEAINALQALRNTIESGESTPITVSKTMTIFKVQNKDTGKELYRSQISITFTAPNDMKDIKIIEVIPKDVAASTDDIVFQGQQPTILQKDPVVQWIVSSLDKGDSKTFEYIVKKKLDSITTSTLTGGVVIEKEEAPPEEAVKPTAAAAAEVKPPEEKKGPSVVVGIIIALLVVVIGLMLYKRKAKKR